MATHTYEILVDGQQVATMTADFAQANSPIMLEGISTPYQVADANHRRQEAAEMLLTWCWSQGTPMCDIDPDGQPIGNVTVRSNRRRARSA